MRSSVAPANAARVPEAHGTWTMPPSRAPIGVVSTVGILGSARLPGTPRRTWSAPSIGPSDASSASLRRSRIGAQSCASRRSILATRLRASVTSPIIVLFSQPIHEGSPRLAARPGGRAAATSMRVARSS
jgi:hypothetical protein